MKHKNENGEVVVEASIIVTLVVIFISIFFYIGMVLYQQSLVSIMANQTASNIAQIYSNTIKDPFTGYIDSDSVYQDITYGSIKTDAYMEILNKKANALAYYRLKSSRILTNGNPNVEVEIVKKKNELLKSQIVVKIKDKYELPLVSMFGVDNKLEFSATGRADCVDVLEYLNGVEAVGDPENSTVTYLPDADSCLVQFFDNINDRNLIKTVPVLRGKSILTSNHYTHSTMPKDLKSDKFKFTGWCLENRSDFFSSTVISGDTAVFGCWECKVVFDPCGGTVSPTSKKVKVWGTAQLPTPSRKGNWTFLGWFTQKNGKGKRYYSNSTIFEDNITLYAHWRCDHDYKLTSSTPATCIVRSHFYYKCKQCDKKYDTEGDYGSHNYGGSVCVYEGTCVRQSVWHRTCSVCNYVNEYCGSYGAHDFHGRCGYTHDLGDESYQMNGHAGKKEKSYIMTTKGECNTCCNKYSNGSYCNAFWDPKKSDYEQGWTTRNNQKVSVGMLCRQHLWKNGKKYSDPAYSEYTNTYLH